ncbi:MAG: hypothetical protein VXW43_10345, partial [Pseudomonadota bacterium]|nr:hypothetical protein [Pseudomonadota bacterium]
NAHDDLKVAFCGGGTCTTASQATDCANHWVEYGAAEYAADPPTRWFDLSACPYPAGACNLNGPSILTGEKAADHILGRSPLPRENAQPWMHPDWQTAQR